MTNTPNYLLIGHVAHDETPTGPKLGGTVSYSGSAAAAVGANVAIVTSAQPDDVVLAELPANAQLHLIPAEKSTVFINTYVGDVRRQEMPSRAKLLSFDDVPEAWRNAEIIHLGPLDDEVNPDFVRINPASLVVATAQGWMRSWDDKGIISPKAWADADRLLPVLDAVVFSEEDIHRDTALETHYAALAKLLVVTRAANGSTVYQTGKAPLNFPAPHVQVVDATGAGVVFAGVFFVMYQRTSSVERAAEAATQLASISVTRRGLKGIPTPEEIRGII
jgi:sugar/nucleoside kinase (ribokinase family)